MCQCKIFNQTNEKYSDEILTTILPINCIIFITIVRYA